MINFLDNLSDEALKKEATTEAKSDTFSSIMKVVKVVNEIKHFDTLCNLVLQSLRHLCQRVSTREDIETFRLKMILRYRVFRAVCVHVYGIFSLYQLSDMLWHSFVIQSHSDCCKWLLSVAR